MLFTQHRTAGCGEEPTPMVAETEAPGCSDGSGTAALHPAELLSKDGLFFED